MILGFHYHVSFYEKDAEIFLPGYIGVFIDGLAQEVDKLVLYLHQARNEYDIKVANYKLKSKNIEIVKLPPKQHLLLRNILSLKDFFKLKQEINKVDIFLFRVPTPLLVNFMVFLKKKYAYLIVGDYVENLEGVKNEMNLFKYNILKFYYKFNKYFQEKFSKNAILFTNNYFIKEYYEKNKKLKIEEIRTTTLSNKDFYKNNKIFTDEKIKIAFAGRIEKSKGLEVLIEGIKKIKEKGYKVELNIAGWDTNQGKYLDYLKNRVQQMNLSNEVKFHGYLTVGEELWNFYRQNDVFIVPTIGSEGFPRVIWEAMSQGLPVIATKVGAIPKVLTNNKNAVLINPGNSDEIVNTIFKLKDNIEFRNKIIDEAFNLVKNNTIEEQSKKLIQILKENL